MMDSFKQYLQEASEVLTSFLSDEAKLQTIEDAVKLIVDSMTRGGKVISCGNGGSMSDAMHFAEELTGRFRNDRPPLPAIAISDPSYLSCVSNDYGYEQVFSRFLEGIGNKGDVLLAISTSGNSANILRAIEVAKAKGIQVIGLTGKDGGKMAGQCDVEIRAPYSTYADHAQEIHIKVIHCLIMGIEKGIKDFN
jgi:D-sedoheptulose 7-phosphate isomerase